MLCFRIAIDIFFGFVFAKKQQKNYSVSTKNVNFINFHAVFCLSLPLFLFFLSLFLPTNIKLAVFRKQNKKSFCTAANNDERKKLYRSTLALFPRIIVLWTLVLLNNNQDEAILSCSILFRLLPGAERERADTKGDDCDTCIVCAETFSLLYSVFDDCVHRT